MTDYIKKNSPLFRSGEIFLKNIEKGHSLSSSGFIFAAWKKGLIINN